MAKRKRKPEPKHTPGPWEFWNEDEDDDREFVVGTDPDRLGPGERPWRFTPVAERMSEADARLIASAPAMALVLAMIAHGVARLEMHGPLVEFCFDGLRFSVGDNWHDLMDLIGWEAARAAIAKERT